MSDTRVTRSADETTMLGREFGRTLRKGDVVGLVGPLGAGKTQFVKGVCSAFGVSTPVLSPSFVIMHRYEGTTDSGEGLVINHFDFYRIRRAEELDEMGFRDLVGGDTISLVEWADSFQEMMPAPFRAVTFEHGEDPDTRTVVLPASGEGQS